MSKKTQNTLSSGSYATRTGGLLMVASMLLLAAFLVFWLRKEYQEQKSILQKETDILFRTTIQSMEDSVIQRKISAPLKQSLFVPAPVKKETTSPQRVTFQLTKTTKESTPTKHTLSKTSEQSNTNMYRYTAKLVQLAGRDSVVAPRNKLLDLLQKTKPEDIKNVRMDAIGNLDITQLTIADTTAKGESKIMIVKSHTPSDSLQRLFGRVARIALLSKKSDSIAPTPPFSIKDIKISIAQAPPKTNGRKKKQLTLSSTKETNFVIRLDEDSLQLKDIKKIYGRQIRQARLLLPFKVIRKKTTDTTAASDSLATLATSAVKTALPMGSTYRAVFADYQGYLLKKIIPQSLFSFLLLAITGLAFGAIYRNLQQQRRLTELKNDFISNMTHELKTPIATVSVAIEALQNFGAAQNPKLTQEYLEISKNELSRLTLLVDKVLKMATFEQQGLQLNQEELDAAQLVEQVLQSMKIQFEKFRANVQFTTQGSDFLLTADRVHLTNVIYNLLDNALKYSESAPEIALQLSETPTQLTLIVSDQGIGIPAEYQTRVFDKFFRVPTGDTHNVKGYGLGLNYVASVVQQHHGTITVESEAGKGSTFTITLPKA